MSLVPKPEAVPSIFMLCDTCFWCATYLEKGKVADKCPKCFAALLSSFPIMPDEAFTFSCDPKHGVELDFTKRR